MRSVHHDHFQQVPGPIGAEDQVAGRVLANLLHDDGVAYGMDGVLHVDVVAIRGSEDIRCGIVLHNCLLRDLEGSNYAMGCGVPNPDDPSAQGSRFAKVPSLREGVRGYRAPAPRLPGSPAPRLPGSRRLLSCFYPSSPSLLDASCRLCSSAPAPSIRRTWSSWCSATSSPSCGAPGGAWPGRGSTDPLPGGLAGYVRTAPPSTLRSPLAGWSWSTANVGGVGFGGGAN